MLLLLRFKIISTKGCLISEAALLLIMMLIVHQLKSIYLDMHEEFYNETIQVEFSAKLRDEKKFVNLEELKEQLQKDKESALLVLQ